MSEPEDRAPADALRLFSDAPVELEPDAFGHRSYATVVVAALTAAEPPFTLGLLGPWGVGKSSVLRRVDSQMTAAGSTVVTFDAWRYDGASLRRQLLRDVAQGVSRSGHLDRRAFNIDTRLQSLDTDEQTTRFSTRLAGGALLVSLLQALVAGVLTLGFLQLHAFRALFAHLDPSRGVLISMYVTGTLFFVSLVAQSFRAVPAVTTRRRVEDTETFERLFRDLVSATRSERLIVAIDNLDRCRPHDALELLATIKTFLEPAAARAQPRKKGARATKALFVLAVDERALLRHLEAAGDAAGDAAEYLRKIFTATVRFGPLLRSDLTAFVDSRLSEAQSAFRLAPHDQQRLGRLVDLAFHDSPRQVIQFLNNFQLRLCLVRERERGTAPMIAGALSQEPLVVAKLLLLEERWPQHFARLKRHPHLLRAWHDQARGSLHGDQSGDDEWLTLAPFLRLSSDIETDDLRPYLWLKQSREELDLPDSDAIGRAATREDREGVEHVLGERPDLVRAYAAHLERLFAQAVEAGDFDAARSLVGVAITSPRLLSGTELGSDLVRLSLDYQPLLQFFPQLPPESLVASVAMLPISSQARVLELVANSLNDDSNRALEAAKALAGAPFPWPAQSAQFLANLCQQTPLRNAYAQIVLLATREPSLLGVTVVDGLVAALRQTPDLIVDTKVGPHVRALVSMVAARSQFGHQASEIRALVATAAAPLVMRGDYAEIEGLIELLEGELGRDREDVDAIWQVLLDPPPGLAPAAREVVESALWQAPPGLHATRVKALLEVLLQTGRAEVQVPKRVAASNPELHPMVAAALVEHLAERGGTRSPSAPGRPALDLRLFEVLAQVTDDAGRDVTRVARRWIDRDLGPVDVRELVGKRLSLEQRIAVGNDARDRSRIRPHTGQGLMWLWLAGEMSAWDASDVAEVWQRCAGLADPYGVDVVRAVARLARSLPNESGVELLQREVPKVMGQSSRRNIAVALIVAAGDLLGRLETEHRLAVKLAAIESASAQHHGPSSLQHALAAAPDFAASSDPSEIDALWADVLESPVLNSGAVTHTQRLIRAVLLFGAPGGIGVRYLAGLRSSSQPREQELWATLAPVLPRTLGGSQPSTGR